MKVAKNTSVYFSNAVIDLVFMFVTSVLAGVTILTHIAQTAGWSFHLFSRACIVFSLATIVLLVLYAKKTLPAITVFDKRIFYGVLLIGMLGATLATTMHRPDSDDYYYVPNAVFHLQNPTEPMDDQVHFFYSAGEPFRETATTTSTPYEYGQAVLATLFRTNLLFFYYLVFPALTGALIPLATYRCLSVFRNDSSAWNLVGCLAVISVMLLLGDTHRSIGGFSFARAFQGKVFFMAVGLPFFAALSYIFLQTPMLRTGLFLLVFSTAMTGLTTTALLILPAFSVILVSAFICTENFSKQSLKASVFYASTLAYIAIRIVVRVHRIRQVDPELMRLSTEGWPTTFQGHLNFLINPDLPLTVVFMIGSTVLSLIFLRKRAFLVLWICFSVLLFLNPWSGNLLIGRFIPANIYWRLFYLLPFPLTIGLAASCICSRIQQVGGWKPAAVSALSLIVFLNLMHIPAHAASVFSPQFGVDIGFPGYKLDPEAFRAAQIVSQKAPAGVMIAPQDIAGITSMISSKQPQMISRCEGVYSWLTAQGKNEEARDRITAMQFLAGEHPHPAAFENLVKMHPALRTVVIKESVLNQPGIGSFLDDQGFVHRNPIPPEWVLLFR